ncbi:hypothetical protein FA13DRAFT_1836806 [Coprinellus micaceus]|uniref:Uncharacterized protein n=1 Tax=Coprinellus micaceus TaxID=71717 RepID=A0A4Y7SFR0_COPMI|nr:hypothetical protein FA13DRAFT_1836806 [Coprinellus micaceus]
MSAACSLEPVTFSIYGILSSTFELAFAQAPWISLEARLRFDTSHFVLTSAYAMDHISLQQQTRNPRTRSLLREVSQGSIPRISRLEDATGWPTDPHDASLVLDALFNLLEKGISPSTHPITNSPPDRSGEMAGRISAVMVAIDCVATIVTGAEGANIMPAVSGIFETHIFTLLRWLKFTCCESTWVFQSTAHPPPDVSGPLIAAKVLSVMWDLVSEKLRITLEASPEYIEFLLFLWNWRDTHKRSLSYTYAQLGIDTVALFLAAALESPAAQQHLMEKASNFTAHQHREIIESSIQRLMDWAHPEQLIAHPISHLSPLVII